MNLHQQVVAGAPHQGAQCTHDTWHMTHQSSDTGHPQHQQQTTTSGGTWVDTRVLGNVGHALPCHTGWYSMTCWGHLQLLSSTCHAAYHTVCPL